MELYPNTVISRGDQLPVSFFQYDEQMFMRYGENMSMEADKFVLVRAMEDSIMLIQRFFKGVVEHFFVGSTVYRLPTCFQAEEIASVSWIPNTRKLLITSARAFGSTKSIVDLSALVSLPESL